MTKREELAALADGALPRSPMQCLLAAAGWDAGSIRHKQLQDALDGAGLRIVEAQASASPPEREAKLRSALHPFVQTLELDVSKDEADEDIFRPMSSGYNRAPLITIGDLRRLAALSSRDDGEARPCTYHPDDNPPVPCARKYAYSECVAASKAPSTICADVLGFAVVSFGKIDVNTVSPTRRGALVNWLVASARIPVYQWTSDEDIEASWRQLCGRDHKCAEVAIAAAISRIDVPGKTTGEPSTIEDRPRGGSIWQAFANLYGNGNLDDEDCAYIDRELVKWRGEKFSPLPAPAAEQGVVSVEELAQQICDVDIRMSLIVAMPIARALLDKYSIRSALMTEGE
jgi:hypothetical protein